MEQRVRDQIQKAIDKNDILLFMKGTKAAPQCGFSAKTVEVLRAVAGDFAAVDVLAHPEVRDGIKEFSSWPTIPQLYVRGKFIGGADIVTEMFESGELHKTIGVQEEAQDLPTLHITPAATAAFKEFLGDSDEIVVLEIDAQFQSALSIGPRPSGKIFVDCDGLSVAMDRLTAGRATGLTIDYVTSAEGPAFRIDNPNEPARVKALSVTALKSKLDGKHALRLIDVRRPDEWATAKIEGAELLDSALHERLLELPKDTTLVFQCHHGHRSQQAAEQFVAAGFTEVFNLTGGIEAWSLQVDSSVPRY